MTRLFDLPWLENQLKVIVGVCAASISAGMFVAWFPREAVLLSGFFACMIVIARYESFLLSGIIFCGMATLLRDASLGPISALGALTIYLAIGSWVLLIARKAWSKWILVVASPLLLFLALGTVSLSWSWAKMAGSQNLLALIAFVGFMMLSAEQSRESEEASRSIIRMTVVATWIAAALYLLQRSLYGADPNIAGIGARGFALLALIGVACSLARWRYESLRGGLSAAGILGLVGFSLSRTALVSGILLIPFARLKPSSVSGWLSFFGWMGLGSGIMFVLVTQVEALRSRFTQGDLDMEIAGIPINVEGRTSYWNATIDSFWQAPWIGQGAGTAEELIALVSNIRHPHNDYLRYLHDFGILGFSVWAIGFVVLIALTFWYWAQADADGSTDATVHLAAFLGLTAVAMAMLTDNVIVYVFVMAPLGAIVGASLGRASLLREGGQAAPASNHDIPPMPEKGGVGREN